MKKKTLTVKKVLIMGAVTGISVILIAYFAIYMQQRTIMKASQEGTLPKAKEIQGLQHYTADQEGAHSYVVAHDPDVAQGNVRVWSRLVYTQEGKNGYIMKRRQRNIFVQGFERLTTRDILYEFNCAKDPAEYAIIEVYEVDETGKTLDYGKTGSSKDWEPIPEGTTIDKLARFVCPALKR